MTLHALHLAADAKAWTELSAGVLVNARKKGSDLRAYLEGLLPAQRTEFLDAIEAERAARGISPGRLAAAAEISESWYRKLLNRPDKATARTLTRLFRALLALRQDAAAAQLDATESARLLRPIYGLTLAIVAAMHGQDVARVQQLLARPGEHTFDPAWRGASLARELAMYLVNQSLDVKQAQLARITGLSRSAIHQAMTRAHDRSEACPVTARVIEIVESILGGDV
jgi:hypothetical protein